jgi:tetratricopeptide (TPR) repeat protein
VNARSLVAGVAGAAATAAAAFAFLAFPPLVAAIPLVLAGALLARSPAAVLLGAATAALALRWLAGWVAPLPGALACTAMALCALWLALRTPSTASPPSPGSVAHGSLRVPLAVLLATLAAVTLGLRVVEAVRFLAGPDPFGLAAACGGLLVAAASGAAAARFLSGRHAREAPLLLLGLGALAVVALVRLPLDATPWLERARALHAPDVSRTQFLAGSALLALLVAGGAAILTGGVLGGLSWRALSPRQAALGAAIGVALALFAGPPWTGFPAACIGLSVALVTRPAVLALLVATAALGAGVLEATRAPAVAIPASAIDADRVYVDLGGLDPIAPGTGAQNAGIPPAWPLDDGIDGIVRWLDASAPPGAIAIGADAVDAVNRLPPRADRAFVVDQALRRDAAAAATVVAWLRPTEPQWSPAARSAPTPPVREGCIVVEPIDLWRVTPSELAAWLALRPDASVLVFGRLAACVGGQPANVAAKRGPIMADPTPTVAAVSPALPPLRSEARTRLVPDLPRTGAKALEAVISQSPRLRSNDSAALIDRARLKLALAILRDDTLAQERTLRLLEATDDAIAALRHERSAARDRLWLRLARLRTADSTDADVRFRFGTVLGRSPAALAGVEELTRCIEFRPTLVDAFEELARAFLAAAERNELKWTATGALDISYAVERLVVLMHPERVDVTAQARMCTLLGRARRAKALRQTQDAVALPLLNDALGRFHRALELTPGDAEAQLHEAVTLREVGETAAAKLAAAKAVEAAPLDARAHALHAATLRDHDVAAARDALRTAFRVGMSFPTTRTR